MDSTPETNTTTQQNVEDLMGLPDLADLFASAQAYLAQEKQDKEATQAAPEPSLFTPIVTPEQPKVPNLPATYSITNLPVAIPEALTPKPAIPETPIKTVRTKAQNSLATRVRNGLLGGFMVASSVGWGLGTATVVKHEVETTEQINSLVPEIQTSQETPDFIKPFVAQAKNRRFDLYKYSPDIAKNVDKELNADKVNFAFVYETNDAEEHSLLPKKTSFTTLVSYNVRTNTVDVISTSNIRSPEAEQAANNKPDDKKVAIGTDSLYKVGGFDLLRKGLINETGLYPDFEFVVNDDFIMDLTKQLMNNEVKVESPGIIRIGDTYENGTRQSPAGWGNIPVNTNWENIPVVLLEKTVLSFVKGENLNKDNNNPKASTTERRNRVVAAIIPQLTEKLQRENDKSKVTRFLAQEISLGRLKGDIDILSVIAFFNNMKSNKSDDETILPPNKSKLPEIGNTVVIASKERGGVGVKELVANTDKTTVKDKEEGVYPITSTLEVPINGDPYSQDLAKDYWKSVREAVNVSLGGKTYSIPKP